VDVHLNIESKNQITNDLEDYLQILKAFKTEGWNQFPSIDLYMDQVITYLDRLLNISNVPGEDSKIITSSMVNNYVKEGYLKRPVNKKYDRNHLASLYIMSMLKNVLPIPLIASSLKDFKNEDECRDFYEAFGKLQDEAFSNVSDKVKDAIEICHEEDCDKTLRLFALQLTSQANAYRIAAEKILYTLNKQAEIESKAKDKEKDKSK
jgi:hypothetical protein